MEGSENESDEWNFVNDWPVRRFILFGACLLVCLSSFLLLRIWSIDNAVTDILGYVFLLAIIFFPGICMMRSMRIHGIGYWRSLIYSVALGIAFLFAMGAGLNLLHYSGLLDEPLTLVPIGVAYLLTASALLALTYVRDREYRPKTVVHEVEPLTVIGWALAALLPILAVIGTNVAGYDGPREILQYLLIALCLAPFGLLTFKIKRYELFILSISLTLILHRSMLTNYLSGYDVFSEYVGASYVITNGFWNVSAYSVNLVGAGANTSLAIVSFIPMVHNLTGIGTLMVFKFVLPLLYSFVPVAIYLVVRDHLGKDAAVISSLLFVGMVEFYGLMFQLGKQEMAEIFLLAMLLVMFDVSIVRSKRKAMALVFLVGVMVSHYAIAFLTLGVFGLMSMFLFLFYLADGLKATGPSPLFRRIPRGLIAGTKTYFSEQLRKKIVGLDLILASGAFFLVWYTYTASGVMLVFFRRGSNAVSNITGSTGYSLESLDMLQYILIDQGSLLHNVPKILFILVQILCVAGVIYAILNRNGIRGNASKEFLALGIVGGVLLLMGYTIPYFSSMFYYGRLFHYALIFLSGFMLIGLMGLHSSFKEIAFFRKKGRAGISDRMKKASFAAAIVLISAIMFTNTSIVYTLVDGGYNTSFAVDDSVSWAIYSDSDVMAVKWAAAMEHRGDLQISADWHRFPIFGGNHVSVSNLLYSYDENDTDSLIYVPVWTTVYNYVYPLNVENTASLTYTDIEDILQQVNDTYGIPYSAGSTSYYYIPQSTTDSNGLGPSIYIYDDMGLYVLYALMALVSVGLVLSEISIWRKR